MQVWRVVHNKIHVFYAVHGDKTKSQRLSESLTEHVHDTDKKHSWHYFSCTLYKLYIYLYFLVKTDCEYASHGQRKESTCEKYVSDTAILRYGVA